MWVTGRYAPILNCTRLLEWAALDRHGYRLALGVEPGVLGRESR
jgi:hypothetical protein